MTHNNLSTERLCQLLVQLSAGGVSQREIAARVGIPSQFLSDLKSGRRILSELTARRIGEEFQVNFEYLLGKSASMSSPRVTIGLPILSALVAGDPRKDLHWDGSTLELAGPAAVHVGNATLPYALRCPFEDRQGRVRPGDILLMSQAQSLTAEISVVRGDGQLWLARRATARGDWKRIDNGRSLPKTSSAVGHCMAIAWGLLLPNK